MLFNLKVVEAQSGKVRRGITHKDHVHVVVVREGLQHLADGRLDEFEGETRDAAAPAG